MEREILINLYDLKHLEMECPNPKCRARITLDVTKSKFPIDCPFCNHDWVAPNASGDPFVRFQRFVETLSNHHARFRIQDELSRSPTTTVKEDT